MKGRVTRAIMMVVMTVLISAAVPAYAVDRGGALIVIVVEQNQKKNLQEHNLY